MAYLFVVYPFLFVGNTYSIFLEFKLPHRESHVATVS